MTLAFLWYWQELLENDPLLACSGVPKAGLDRMGPRQGPGQGQGPLLSHQAEQEFSLKQPCTSAQVSVRECGWIHAWIFHRTEAPGHLF